MNGRAAHGRRNRIPQGRGLFRFADSDAAFFFSAIPRESSNGGASGETKSCLSLDIAAPSGSVCNAARWDTDWGGMPLLGRDSSEFLLRISREKAWLRGSVRVAVRVIAAVGCPRRAKALALLILREREK